MNPTCLQCLNRKATISKVTRWSSGRKVTSGIVECATKGQTRIIELRDCRVNGAALDKDAE